MTGFTKVQSYNGVSYKVYVPENCNSNTEVLVYCHGGEDAPSWYGSEYLANNGGDTVVIFPTADESFRETNDYGYQVANIVNNVKQDLNITNTSLSVAGFSKGSTPTYTIMGEYLKQNPNCSSSTMFLLDNYPNAKFSSTKKFDSLLNDYGSYYKDNDTMFVAMIPQWSETGTNIIGAKQAELDALARYGLTNISVLHSHKATYPGYYKGLNIGGDSHQVVEQGFWVDGFFNMSSNGAVLYGEDEYKLTIFNKSTGQYEITDFANLNSLDKLRQYFGINIGSTGVTNLNNASDFLKDEISKLAGLSLYSTSDSLVKSDKDVLLGNVNNVITDIKNTSFVSNGLDLSFNGVSTTKVPSGIPNIIGLYFTFTTNMLTDLSTFMNKVATAGESIDKMDEELGNEANNLNNNVQLNPDTSTITDSVTGNNSSLNNGDNTASVNDNNYNNGLNYNTNNNYNNGYNKNNSGTVSNNSYNTGSNNNYSTGSNNYSTGSNNSYTSNNNDKVTSIPQDTWEGATNVVGNENVTTTPSVNTGGGISNTVGTNDIVSTPEVPNDSVVSIPEDTDLTLPEVDVPKHDINNIIIEDNSSLGDSNVVTPEIGENINNNDELVNVPVTNPAPIKKDNTLSNLGVALGVGAALGAGGFIAAKSFNKNKKETEEVAEDSDLAQYKDDYFEEV